MALELSATITGLLGPLAAAVERMGVTLDLTFTEGAGSRFGPIDASLAFKPPNGVGLSIDIGVIKGGGYLYIDVAKGEYAGALELVFSGFLSLSAIGIISTRMPDGTEGFSLLIVVTAEFGVPLQLGFGFTLIGVGGLLGLNRTADVEQLALGVRDGSIESVMFPTDVIANAPQIISDMRRFFPAEEDTFLIGLMAKLGWGTPTLVSASLGIVIEVPPGNIVILGILKVALPDEDAALLVLQVNFIGAYEVDKERIWFFASLYESPGAVHHHRRRHGAAHRLGRRRQLRGERGRLPPFLLPAAPALPDPEPSERESAQRVVRHGAGRGLLRRHLEHGPVRGPCRALLRPR